MKVEFRKRFLKELSTVPAPYREAIEKFVFEELPQLASITSSGKIERLKGYPGYYKVRFGDYRVGIATEADTIILERVLHRKEIYKYYP